MRPRRPAGASVRPLSFTFRLPSPMRRKLGFLAVVGSAYLACFSMPVDHNFFIGDVPGWAAFVPALYLNHYREMSSLGDLAWVVSAWTNVIFALSFLSLIVRSRVPSSLLVLALLSAAIFNLVYWTYTIGAELRVGFYLWILSFVCLAAGTHVFRDKQVTDAAA